MATGKLTFDEGTTSNVATYTITEDAVTKHINRTVLNTSAGVEISPATAAKQPALGTAGSASTDVITVQGIASMTKLLVTPDLPSGASTAAKQPALGTAGTASTDVITVQGIASMTKLLVTPDLPSGASTSAKQDTTNTSLATIAGAVYAEDTGSANLDPGVMVLARRTDSPANTSGANLDYESLQMSAGRLWASATIDAALPTGTNSIGQVTANAGTNLNTSALALEAGGNLAGAATSLALIDDVVATLGGTQPGKALAIAGSDGSNSYKMLTDTSGRVFTNIAQINAVTPLMGAGNTGTGSLRVTIASDQAIIPISAVGTIADDATTPGNPVVIGGKAVETDGTDPSSVSAEDDVAIVRTDRNRRMLVNDFHPNHWTLFEDHTSAQTNNQLKSAPGANLSLYITDVIFSNGATAGSIKLVEDESGTPVQISQTLYMAINGGAVIHWKTPKRLTANKTLGFTSTTVTTHSVEVHGFIAP